MWVNGTSGKRIPAALAAMLALTVLAGVIRFADLARKGYTNDEATTSIHVAGHTIADYAAAAFDGRPHSVEELDRFQYVDRSTHAGDVVAGLAREDPQHPPLYYLLERGWVGVAGDSVAAKRSLSAIAGALLVAAMGWLAVELFLNVPSALVVAGLVVVSPFHVVYAQQAREYALWTLLVALASAALLRGLRLGSRAAWVGYGVLLTLALYTDPLTLVVVAAHALYVGLLTRLSAASRPYLCASTLAIVAYLPWVVVMLHGMRDGKITNNTYLASGLPAKLFALKWIFNAGTVFYDLDYRWPFTAVLLLPIFAAIAVAFVLLVRRTPQRVWLFVVTLGLVDAAALLIPDLVFQQTRSTSARYLAPAWLAVELALGWFIALAFRTPSRRSFGIAAAAFCGALGLVSCVVGLRQDAWWADGTVSKLNAIARQIGTAPQPLVVYHETWSGRSEAPQWDFVIPQLVDELPRDVHIQQIAMDAYPTIAPWRGVIFLVDPTDAFRARLRALGAVLTPVALDDGREAASLRSLRAEAQSARGAQYRESNQTLWRVERRPASQPSAVVRR